MDEWTCNIDKRGRLFRGFGGLVAIGIGIYLLLRTEHDFWATGLLALGAFALFEGLKGWCALRAIGIKTPF